ncbi:MAG: hypothetical protein J6T98_11725 [Salinivirgaceae bacterium]|nr:hypothetical protein [Salinivirgaceae bacterium]
MAEKLSKELNGVKKYILAPESEAAKRYEIDSYFKKLFPKQYKVETDAERADIYIVGKLVVELKSKTEDWLKGFYQALHYAKKGLSFNNICVITHDFLGFWRIANIPEFARKLAADSDETISASSMGPINAGKTKSSELKNQILKSATCLISGSDTLLIDILLLDFDTLLQNMEDSRIQIRYNFINAIEYLKKFYTNPIDAVHCFYSMVGFWDSSSLVVDNDPDDNDVQIISQNSSKSSEQINIESRYKTDFKKFVESHYIYTNEGEGFTADYYFSRFDEVLSRIMPEYVEQHGIYFTDINLSRFALWYVHEKIEAKLDDKYIIFDPAGGSGNLVTSWRGRIKHKIISELQPDLLKTIERRMKLAVKDDLDMASAGFTIIPKTKEDRGLNFLDKSAEEYMTEILEALDETGRQLDKPLAFLMNPPYKSTDENEGKRVSTDSDYDTHPSIMELTGNDAAKDRCLAFLGQILNIARWQHSQNPEMNPLLMIFTPTSWLFPRQTFIPFRKIFDRYFKYEKGFIVNGKEFFKDVEKFPIAFTIWRFDQSDGERKNIVKIDDFCHLAKRDLQEIRWKDSLDNLSGQIRQKLEGYRTILLALNENEIRTTLPCIEGKRQPRYDFMRTPTKTELSSNQVYGGLPLNDRRRLNKKTYGAHNGTFIGFMDDITPVRIKQDTCNRMTNKCDRIWMRLDVPFINTNYSQILSGTADHLSYCAYDLPSAKATLSWFGMTKAFNGNYPTCYNQSDIWAPEIKSELADYYHALCFAFGYAENRCVVTKFEKDNPVEGAPEIFVDNPMSPMNEESFWRTTLRPQIKDEHKLAMELVSLVDKLYLTFRNNYCIKSKIEHVGLQDEPYFKYFDYPDFLTMNSGIIQIKKYAEINCKSDLLDIHQQIMAKSKEVKDEIYRLLVDEFKYFG